MHDAHITCVNNNLVENGMINLKIERKLPGNLNAMNCSPLKCSSQTLHSCIEFYSTWLVNYLKGLRNKII